MNKLIFTLALTVIGSFLASTVEAGVRTKTFPISSLSKGVKVSGPVSTRSSVDAWVKANADGVGTITLKVVNRNRYRGFTAGVFIILRDDKGQPIWHQEVRRGINAKGFGRRKTKWRKAAINIPKNILTRAKTVEVKYGHFASYKALLKSMKAVIPLVVPGANSTF